MTMRTLIDVGEHLTLLHSCLLKKSLLVERKYNKSVIQTKGVKISINPVEFCDYSSLVLSMKSPLPPPLERLKKWRKIDMYNIRKQS